MDVKGEKDLENKDLEVKHVYSSRPKIKIISFIFFLLFTIEGSIDLIFCRLSKLLEQTSDPELRSIFPTSAISPSPSAM